MVTWIRFIVWCIIGKWKSSSTIICPNPNLNRFSSNLYLARDFKSEGHAQNAYQTGPQRLYRYGKIYGLAGKYTVLDWKHTVLTKNIRIFLVMGPYIFKVWEPYRYIFADRIFFAKRPYERTVDPLLKLKIDTDVDILIQGELSTLDMELNFRIWSFALVKRQHTKWVLIWILILIQIMDQKHRGNVAIKHLKTKRNNSCQGWYDLYPYYPMGSHITLWPIGYGAP